MLRCIKCNNETPGFEEAFDQLKALQNSKKVNLKDDFITKALRNSEVLKTSVKLSPKFSSSTECNSTEKSATGICFKCANYYTLDDDGNIKPKADYAKFVQDGQTSTDRQQKINVKLINPYSAANLVATCIWNDEAYRLFVLTLTEAEKMVLTPLHLQVCVLRLRVNNISFSSHGAICYPLKKPSLARALPWWEWAEIPFVVMTYKDKLGSAHEATVDMDKIRKAIEFMNRDMPCPVYGTPRKYYRFCKDIPFSNENMRHLSNSLEDPSTRSYPKDVRTILVTEVHKRAKKPLALTKFENWLQSGYECATSIWDKYKLDCFKNNQAAVVKNLFTDIQNHFSQTSDQPENNVGINESSEPADKQLTVCNVVQYSVLQKWLSGITNVIDNNQQPPQDWSSIQNLPLLNIPPQLKELILNCCEELELVSREYSNDEGPHSAVASGVRMEIETEHPDYLIQQGLQQSILHRIPMPQPIWESPLAEHTPGFFQMAFPFIFRTGDADPYQDRPRDIKEPKTSWEEHYYEWIAKLPEAHGDIKLQFYLNGKGQRIANRKNVMIAVKTTGINRDELPTKEDLISNPERRQDLASKVLSFTSQVKDTDSFWFDQRNDMLGALRYFADPPAHREITPMESTLFKTRALSYNHLHAIHSLFPNASEIKKDPEKYFKFRLANVLSNPLVVQFVGSLIMELDSTIAANILHDTTIYWLRHEWGPNANPHTHTKLR